MFSGLGKNIKTYIFSFLRTNAIDDSEDIDVLVLCLFIIPVFVGKDTVDGSEIGRENQLRLVNIP